MLDEVLQIDLQTKAHFPVIDGSTETSTTDDELVRSVLDGNDAAFAAIFEKYKSQMTRTVGRFFRERDDIEECVQRAFTKAYFQLKDFRGSGDGAFPAWITRIAVNVCYDEFRRRQRKGATLLTELTEVEEDHLLAVADGRGSSAESSLIASQLADKVLASLDPKDRLALTLVYSEDYSLAEAAGAIGISESNLKSRLFRCRNSIKAKFGYLFR